MLLHSDQFQIVVRYMTTLDKFLTTVSNKKNVLSAYVSLVFATSEYPEKHLIIQSMNTVMNIKSTQNTQEMLSNIFHRIFNILCHFAIAIFYKIRKSTH